MRNAVEASLTAGYEYLLEEKKSVRWRGGSEGKYSLQYRPILI